MRSMPNSFLPPATNRTPGLVIAGDALNMRHPLTGGGMTVAFNDVVLLAELLHPNNVPSLADHRLVLKQMKAFHWRRKNWAAVINILALALYALFAADKAFFTPKSTSLSRILSLLSSLSCYASSGATLELSLRPPPFLTNDGNRGSSTWG